MLQDASELADGFPDFQEYLLRQVLCQIRVIIIAARKSKNTLLQYSFYFSLLTCFPL